MKTIITFFTTISLTIFFIGLVGCGVAQVALEKHRESKPGKINVAKTPSYNPDQVAKYNKIIVTSRESGGNPLGGAIYGGATETGGASAEILSGRIALELAKAGYDVLEQAELEQTTSGQKTETDKEPTLFELANNIKADAILSVVTQQGTVGKVGTFGLGAGIESGIVSTSLKLIDATTERTIAVISSDYPEPRTATQVIEGLLPSIFQVLPKPEVSTPK